LAGIHDFEGQNIRILNITRLFQYYRDTPSKCLGLIFETNLVKVSDDSSIAFSKSLRSSLFVRVVALPNTASVISSQIVPALGNTPSRK
jgi:hypothetical protein